MKSMKRVLSMAIASGISVFSFAQVNLGLQSTTQAAINATAATGAITSTTNATTQATKATVNSTVTKVGDVKSTAIVTGKQTISTAKEAGSSVNANAGINSSSNGEVNGQGSALSSNNSISANEEMNGDRLVNKAGQTTSATVNTAREVKSTVVSEVRSGVNTAKQTTTAAKPSIEANGSAETKVAGSVK